MENVNRISKEGLDKLRQELKNLVDVKRPEIIKQIQKAREEGDLSENADYDAAKNEQARIEKRISEIEDILNHAEEIDDTKLNREKNVVNFGSTVVYVEDTTKKEYKIYICGSIEANPREGWISNEAPLAKAILGRKKGDTVEIRGIDTPYKVTIKDIKNK